MKVYIAGKITGNKKYHEMFDLAERVYSKKYIVLNPATLPEGMSAADYMRICFAMIDAADLVAFLPGWRTSPGTMLASIGLCNAVTAALIAELSDIVTERVLQNCGKTAENKLENY